MISRERRKINDNGGEGRGGGRRRIANLPELEAVAGRARRSEFPGR